MSLGMEMSLRLTRARSSILTRAYEKRIKDMRKTKCPSWICTRRRFLFAAFALLASLCRGRLRDSLRMKAVARIIVGIQAMEPYLRHGVEEVVH